MGDTANDQEGHLTEEPIPKKQSLQASLPDPQSAQKLPGRCGFRG